METEEKIGKIREAIFDFFDCCYASDHLRNQTFLNGTLDLKDPNGLRAMITEMVRKKVGIELDTEVIDNVLSLWQEQRKDVTPNEILMDLAMKQFIRKQIEQLKDNVVETAYGHHR